MNPNEFIETYNSNRNELIYFKWNGKHANELVDENIHFRRELLKYIESIDFNHIPGELLRDLIIAESQYAKESWGIYRHYYLIVENLLNQTGDLYLVDVIIAASFSFDTYCSTVAANPTELDFDAIIVEMKSRKEVSQDEVMRKTFDMGIDIFTSYKSKQSKVDEVADTITSNTKISTFLKIKKISKSILKAKGVNKVSNKKIKWIIISFAFFIIAVIAVKLIMAFGGDMVVSHNVSTFTSKSNVNGNVNLTIGTLKGTYKVHEYTIKTAGKVSIPYESTVESGNVTLQVVNKNLVQWEKVISPSSSGLIEFNGVSGSYSIQLVTEEAKKISVKLNLK
ncbi:hypothetical protein AB4114_33015 [Paenibacillus sp. 2RAB27]|uniref:hypothetical protein n=1 Tax=Paenibacillus sp. 2RAB27 TaxID=3232991 RepID=UPI003F99CB1B